MKRKIVLFIICTTLGYWVRGQSFSPSVLAVATAESFSPKLSLEWTIGEFAVDYLSMDQGMLTEGFHQPVLGLATLPDELFSNKPFITTEQERIGEFAINVWPNPVHSVLNIQIETETGDEVFIELIDVMGRKTISKTSHIPYGLIELDVSQNPSGLYLLKFFEKDGTLIKTILNTKH